MPVKPRGNGLEVSVQVTREGKKHRYRQIIQATHDQATAHEAQVRADLLAGREPTEFHKGTQKGSKGIKLREALEVVFERYWKDGSNARTSRYNIEDCMRFFGEDKTIDDITTSDADDWIDSLHKRGLAPSTIRQKCCVMTKMYNHFMRRGNITKKPHFELPPIGDNTRDRVVTQKEEHELIGLFYEHYDAVLARRGRTGFDYACLFAFLRDVGCRPSEARKLTMSKCYSGGRITFKATKNGKPRTIPLTNRAKFALVSQANTHGEQPFAWATPEVIRHAWDWARENMGLGDDEGFIPYALRHTCATVLYARTKNILLVSKWLGHKTIQMTMRYAKLLPHDLDEARDMLEAA